MALIKFNAEGGFNNAVVTTANSFTSGGTPLQATSGTAVVYSADTAAHGDMSMKFSGSANSYVDFDAGTTGSSNVGAFRFYMYLTAYPTTTATIANGMNSGGNLNTVFFLTPTGTINFRGSGTPTLAHTGTVPLPLNQWVRIEYRYQNSSGQWYFDWYIGDSTTPEETVYLSISGMNAGQATGLRVGRISGASTGWNMYVDDLAVRTGGLTYEPIGPEIPTPHTSFKSNNADGGAHNVTVTTANSGGDSGDAFNAVSGTTVFTNSLRRGTTGFGYDMRGAQATRYFTYSLGTVSKAAVRFYIYKSAASASTPNFVNFYSGTTPIYRLYISAEKMASVINPSATLTTEGTVNMPLSKWVRVEVMVDLDNDQYIWAMYDGDSTVPVEKVVKASDFGGVTSIDQLHIGNTSTSRNINGVIDDIKVGIGGNALVGPPPPIVYEPTTIYSNDFSSGWGPSWTITGSSAASGGWGQLTTSASSTAYTRAHLSGMTDESDTDFYHRFYLSDFTSGFQRETAYINGDSGGTGTPTNGYVLTYTFSQSAAGGEIEFFRISGGSALRLQQLQNQLMDQQNASQPYNLRIQREGSVVRYKTWLGYGTEPAEWWYEYTDASPLPAGKVGIANRNVTDNAARTVYVDDVVVIAPREASETTTVSTTVSESYAVRAAVSGSISEAFSVRSQVSTTRAETYAVRTTVVDTVAETYGVRTSVAGSIQETYSLRASTSNIRTDNWGVKSQVTSDISEAFYIRSVVAATNSETYAVREQVEAVVSETYDTEATASVSKVVQERYAVRTSASVSRSESYGVRVPVEATNGALWAVQGLVEAIATEQYAVRLQVTDTTTEQYAVRSRVTATRSEQFAVEPAPITLSNTAEGGTHAVIVTAGNSGGASGTAFSTVVGSGFSYSNAFANTGTLSYRYQGGSGVTRSGGLLSAGEGSTIASARAYIYLPTLPSTTNYLINISADPANLIGAALAISSTGKLGIAMNTGGATAIGDVTMPTNTWIRVEYYYNSAAGNAVARWYLGHDTQHQDSVVEIGTPENTNLTGAFFGKFLNTQPTSLFYMDNVAFRAYSGVAPGPVPHPVTSTVSEVYGVRTRTEVASQSALWAVRERTLGSVTERYGVRRHIIDTVTERYGIRVPVSTTLAEEFGVRVFSDVAVVTNSWDVDAQVQALISDSWNVDARVTKIIDTRWRVLGPFQAHRVKMSVGTHNSRTSIPVNTGTGKLGTIEATAATVSGSTAQATIHRNTHRVDLPATEIIGE